MALQVAVSGIARAGNTRSGYAPAALASLRTPAVSVVIAGINRTKAVDLYTITPVDELNELPNTCDFECFGFTPAENDAVVIRRVLDGVAEFAGTITRVKLARAKLTQGRVPFQCHAIDYTRTLDGVLITKAYGSQSATAIALDLMSRAPAGFTAHHVADALPTVEAIQFKMTPISQCLRQLCDAFGGDTYIDYDQDAHVFDTETDVTPATLNTSNRDWRNFTYEDNTEALYNRILVEGGGTAAAGACDAGETIIPIDDPTWYAAGGGSVITGNQILTYLGIVPGGGGGIVGPGVTPSAGPSMTLQAGSGVEAGTHGYAYTWTTPGGETAVSPIATVTPGVVPTPAAAPAHYADSSTWTSRYNVGDTLRYAISYSYGFTPGSLGDSATVAGTAYTVAAWSGVGSHPAVQHVTAPYSSDPLVKYIQVWCDRNGGGLQFLTTITNINTFRSSFDLIDAFGSVGGVPPTASPTLEQVALDGIAVGPTGTTGRKLYRTVAGGSQLKLLHTFADNTSTTFTDSTADASLGAAPPTSDTSGLTIAAVASSFTTSVSGFSANGAATLATSSAPVFTSASYNFVAADVGASLYIKSGTNWIAGFYVIVSVASNAATLNAPCASVASPTSATWGVDYTGLASPRVQFTDLVISGTTNTQCTSAANPVGVNFVGNSIQITNGLGFVRQSVTVLSISGVIAICDKSLGSLSSTGGLATLGGAFAASVAAGSTSLLLSSAGAFSSTGGWVQGQGPLIRYRGISGNTLTGIPATGTGSIQASIAYNTTVTAVATLTGIPASGDGAMRDPIAQGDSVDILVQRDDLASQAIHGLLTLAVQDRRLSIAGAQVRGDAELATRAAQTTITYITEDRNVRSGRQVTLDMAAEWGLSGTFKIQTVRGSFDRTHDAMQRDVTLSNQSTDKDLYRILRALGRQASQAA